MRHRPSEVDRFLACASSALPTEYPYNPRSEISAEGDAGHEAMAIVTPAQEFLDQDRICKIADKHGVDPSIVAKLTAFGLKAFREIGKWVPNPKTEVKMKNDLFKGTSDVVGFDGRFLSVIDWKFGYLSESHSGQLMAYADLARSTFEMPTSGQVYAFEVWGRSGTYQAHRWDAEDLDGFREKVLEQQKRVGNQYAPGDACRFCPRQNQCPARDDYLRSSAVSLIPLGEDRYPIPSDEAFIKLEPKAKALRKALDRFDNLLHQRLEAGPLDLGDGKSMILAPYQTDEIDPRLAWPVLVEEFGFGEDEMAQVLSVKKTEMTRIVSEKAPRGLKGKRKAEIVERLRETGASTQVTRRKKSVVESATGETDA